MGFARPPAQLTNRSFSWCRCRANVAHVRQSGPDSGLGLQAKPLKTFEGVPFSLGIGSPCAGYPPPRCGGVCLPLSLGVFGSLFLWVCGSVSPHTLSLSVAHPARFSQLHVCGPVQSTAFVCRFMFDPLSAWRISWDLYRPSPEPSTLNHPSPEPRILNPDP